MCSMCCHDDMDPVCVHSYMKTLESPVSAIKKTGLTVRTPVGLQPESDPPVGVPVQRNEAQEASDRRLLQFVLNHTVCITVTWKRLKTHKQTEKFPENLQKRMQITSCFYPLLFCEYWELDASK